MVNRYDIELSGRPGMTSRERATGSADLSKHLGSVSSPQNSPEHLYRIHNSSKSSPSPHYLELVDNVSSKSKSSQSCNWLEATCDTGKGYFIAAECEEGHRFAKELVCNKEWCRVCGEDGSIAHNRRFIRWLPKIQQLKSVGYFVFTIPEDIRYRYRSKASLGKLGHDVQEILKNHGFSRGLRRWHLFGDESTKYHPHLNLLVDGAFISRQLVNIIKSEYSKLLGVDNVSIHYGYRSTPGKMIHTLKYVTRATFRQYEWDPQMALEIHNFRNMVVWGRGLWSDKAGILSSELEAWSMEAVIGKDKKELSDMDVQAISELGSGNCPVCHKTLHWSEALPVQLLKEVNKTSYGAGYYRLDDIKVKCRQIEMKRITDREIAEARGNYIRIATHSAMKMRKAKYISDLERLDIKPDKNRHVNTYDPYWDDPKSEEFIDPSEYDSAMNN